MMTQQEKPFEVNVNVKLVSENEVVKMAEILRKKHGVHAYAVAKHFMHEHLEIADKVHANAWARVAQHIFETTDIC